jgi:hypothetical protein
MASHPQADLFKSRMTLRIAVIPSSATLLGLHCVVECYTPRLLMRIDRLFAGHRPFLEGKWPLGRNTNVLYHKKTSKQGQQHDNVAPTSATPQTSATNICASIDRNRLLFLNLRIFSASISDYHCKLPPRACLEIFHRF